MGLGPCAGSRHWDAASEAVPPLHQIRYTPKMNTDSIPLSLYIHLPWCIRKCPYCDFNSHASPDVLPEARYVKAVLKDLDRSAAEIGSRPIRSIFLGGGTPSLFSGQAVRNLLGGIRQRVSLDPEAEITLEANPGAAEAARFEAFREAGVNRLSIGIQSFDPGSLKALGRVHDGQQALGAIRAAHAAGMTELNLDLMYGLPGQSPDGALKDLETALQQNPSHLSYYQLTVEPETGFAKSPPILPEESQMDVIEQQGLALLEAEGYQRYEVSAFARQGSQCRHNLNYWTFGDYLGLGAGAHGKITRTGPFRAFRTQKIRHPTHYMTAMETPPADPQESEITQDHLVFEFLMNALRLSTGFVPAVFEARTGLGLETLQPALDQLSGQGLLEQKENTIRCSPLGYRHLDTILQHFLPG